MNGSDEHEAAVDVDEMARILKVSKATVYTWAKTGQIPGVKIGRLWRFFPSEVRAYLDRPRDPWAQSARSLGRKRYHGEGSHRRG